MRFISLRRKHGKGWLCLCIVKRWRPIYVKWNARFAMENNLVRWIIMEEQTFTEAEKIHGALRPLSR